MIKILLVEDDAHKRRLIATVLSNVPGVEADSIQVATDVVSAKRELQSKGFDLLLLDIYLPKRADGHAERDGGLEVLRWLKRRGKAHRPPYIVGTTVHDESLAMAKSEFDNLIWSVVRFDFSDNAWKAKLTATVAAILDQLVPPYVSDGSTYKTDIGVVVALEDPELRAILGLPFDWCRMPVRFDEAVYHWGRFENGSKNLSIVATAAPDKGLSAAAVSTTKLIHAFHPRYLVMTGICAGVRGRVTIGDILIADPSWDWGCGKTKGSSKKAGAKNLQKERADSFQAAPYQMRIDETIRSRAAALFSDGRLLRGLSSKFDGTRAKKTPSLRIGPVASGAAVLQSKEAISQIIAKHKDLIGIDMEIYSVMYACHVASLPRPTCFALKSVCDFGEEGKSNKFQPYASYLSAHALHNFMTEL